MNPYEVSQASSDAIQALTDNVHKLEDHVGLIPAAVVERLQQGVLRLQHLHSRSWYLLRHNEHPPDFLMARLESMDVLCGRLLPAMSSARGILGKSTSSATISKAIDIASSNGWRKSGYEFLSPVAAARGASCCYPFMISNKDKLAEALECVSDELERWLDRQEAVLDHLSRQAYGSLSRQHSHSLEGYQRIPKVMRTIGEALIFSEQKVVVLHGPPGVGKSSLAAFVVASPPECFSDGAVEVQLGSDEEMVLSRLRHLLLELNCHRESVSKAVSAADCWTLLEEAVQDSNHLIVLDDIPEKGIIERLVGMRKSHNCKFLVTCQDDPMCSDESVCTIKLGFKETALVSEEILKFHTGMRDLPAVSTKLMRYCSHHPLSISILGEALRGSWKTQEWKAVLNHFELCSSGPPSLSEKSLKPRKRKNGSVKPLNWMAGVVASIEMGRVGMQQETQHLFDSFSALSWSGPVPVECLKALWTAVGNKSPFLVHARDLVRRCLLKRRPDFIFYEMHELVGVYLERKLTAALDNLLKLSQPGVRAVIAPWLLHFGNAPAKHAAARTLRGLMVLDSEELHATTLVSIVEVLKTCPSSREEICREVNSIVGAEIVNLLFRASSPWVYAAITKYISTCFSDVDYEEYGRGLVASGLVDKLRSLLTSASSSGVNTLVKKDVADVLAKVAGCCSRDRYVVESLIRGDLMPELVKLVDSRSGWIHEGAINAVVKLTCIDGAAVEQMLKTDMLEKLMVLMQSRKQSAKSRAAETIGELIRSGGFKVVERVVQGGVLEELEEQLQGCSSEDVQAGCCSVCGDLFEAAEDGECLERVLRSKLVEKLTGLLMGDVEEVVRSRAVAALQALVKREGKPVVERIVRAAGVDSIVKGLETLPNDAAFSGVYRNLLKSIVD